MAGSSSDRNVTRRVALALLGGGVAGGAALGLSRRDMLSFLRRDAETDDAFRVMRRPYPSEPGREVSALGFGCGAKLPVKNRDKRCIDEELATELMDFAVRHGVNYFDTGYNYHEGESERFLGRVLPRYPRESILLADKMPTWLVKKPEDAPRIFEEQLRKCRVEYFDNYLLHSVNKLGEYERVYHQMGVLDYLKEQKAKGRIRHLGFSFHGTGETLLRVLKDYSWEMVQVMINALENRWNPDSLKVMKILAERNVPIFIMQPLAGGRAASLNKEAQRILSREGGGMSAAEWGFRYAMSFPNVLTVLSGMSRMEWVVENIRTLSAGRFRPFDAHDREVYGRVVDAYMKYKTIPCTSCRYCVPCPYGVAIPEIFAWWNAFAGAGRLPTREGANDSQKLRREFLASYSNAVRPGCGPEKCIGCRKCLVACPQWTFRIPDEIRKIDQALASIRADYVKKGGRL